MFVFGHLGIGSGLVLLAKRDVHVAGVLVGTLLPDLVDKPLFYGLVRTRLLPPHVCAWLPGTRTVAHTLIAAGLASLLALVVRPAWRPACASLALGMASHDLLDIVSDVLASAHLHVPFTLAGSGAWRAAFFPLAGTPFGTSVNIAFYDHFTAALKMHLPTELLGAALLGGALTLRRTRRSHGDAPPSTTGSKARG